jgi:hypothetical protein
LECLDVNEVSIVLESHMMNWKLVLLKR